MVVLVQAESHPKSGLLRAGGISAGCIQAKRPLTDAKSSSFGGILTLPAA